MRPLLIRSHQARIACDVGGEDCGEATDRGHLSRGGDLLNQVYLETGGDPSVTISPG